MDQKLKIILLSAKGKKWNQTMAKKYAKLNNIIFICGRYEGVDERIIKIAKDMFSAKNVEEISIGDYVLTGGEIPTMIIVDSVTRLLPGVLGNKDSIIDECHSKEGLLEYPQYTRPEVFSVKTRSYRVPRVLLSGNHQKIAQWRLQKKRRINTNQSPKLKNKLTCFKNKTLNTKQKTPHFNRRYYDTS